MTVPPGGFGNVWRVNSLPPQEDPFDDSFFTGYGGGLVLRAFVGGGGGLIGGGGGGGGASVEPQKPANALPFNSCDEFVSYLVKLAVDAAKKSWEA